MARWMRNTLAECLLREKDTVLTTWDSRARPARDMSSLSLMSRNYRNICSMAAKVSRIWGKSSLKVVSSAFCHILMLRFS